MMFIPGIIIAVVTFPGVIIHEAAHQLFCRLCGVAVYEVKYFQFDLTTQGYVLHGGTKNFGESFLISVGPFLLNTLLCFLICIPASLPYQVFGDRNPVTYALLWLGVSIGMHAFPSTGDASGLWEQAVASAKKLNILAIISFPIIVLIFVANVLRVIWFDALYGFFIGIIVPTFIFKHL